MFQFWWSWLTGKSSAPAGGTYRPGKKRSSRGRVTRRPTARPLVEELETRLVPAGTWTAVNPAPSGVGLMMLLSDGSVMAQQAGVTNVWYKFTPSSNGAYASGTWSTLAPMSLQRQYFASNVLKDGRVFLVGGEYSGSPVQNNDINTGEIYDPVSNSWSAITNYPQSHFGDDPSILLDSGQVLCGDIGAFYRTYLYNPLTNTWTETGLKIHGDYSSDEETWLKLPDGSVLSYDIVNDTQRNSSTAQRYVPSTGTWVDAGTVPVDLSSSALGEEMGGPRCSPTAGPGSSAPPATRPSTLPQPTHGRPARTSPTASVPTTRRCAR